MKNFSRVLSSILLLGFYAATMGCGGGGGGDDDDGAGASQPGFAPATIAGKSLQLQSDTGEARQLGFVSASSQFVEFEDGAAPARSGTFAYEPSANRATVTLVDGQTGAVRTLRLEFQSATSGLFHLTTGTGVSTGSFTLTALGNTPPDHGGNSGGNSGGTGGGGSDNGDGQSPDPNIPPGDGGLDGRIFTLTRSTGQMHTYTFTGSRFVDSDPPEEGSGTYTYDRVGSQGTLVLHYTGSTGPVNLVGDRHEIHLNFITETEGTYTSTYFTNDGAALAQDGVFEVIQ